GMCAYDHEPSPEHFIPGSGGIFRDLHVHDFDVARWLTGSEVERVYALGSFRRWERFARHDDVDTAAILLTMDDGLAVVVTGSRHNPRGYDFRLEVLASDDSISVGLDERTPLRPLEASAPQFGTTLLGAGPYVGFLDRYAAAFDAEMHAWLEFARGER